MDDKMMFIATLIWGKKSKKEKKTTIV